MSRNTLSKFFVFNGNISKRETTSTENILYYWPSDAELERRQAMDVGLATALIGFASTFTTIPLEVMETEKHKQVFFSPEPEFWFVMSVRRPKKEDDQDVRELDYHILLAILRKAARTFRLLNGSLATLLAGLAYENRYAVQESLQPIKEALSGFFDVFLPALNFDNADVFDALDGIQFLPVDRLSFLRMQSFVNKIETHFEGRVLATTVLVDDFLLYSGVNQNDTRCIYHFLTKRRQRLKGEVPIRQRGDNVIFLSHTARAPDFVGFLMPDELPPIPTAASGSPRHVPPSQQPMIIFTEEFDSLRQLNLVVWSYHKAIFALYVDPLSVLSDTFLHELDAFMREEIKNTVSTIVESITRTTHTVDESYQYIYFNHMNLALKSSLRKKGTLVGSASNSVSVTDVLDMMGHVEAMHADFEMNTEMKEAIIKAKKDSWWVAGRKSGNREFYALFDSKSGLVEVNDEVTRISQTFFNGIFVD